MCARNECDSRGRTRTKKTITTTRAFTCSPSVCHRWVSVLRVDVSLDLGFHVVIGVGRLNVQQEGFVRQLLDYAIPSAKFFPCGCCSPTLPCHRPLNLYPKFLHISHPENGSFDVLSLQNQDYQPCTCHCRNDEERITVLLVHTGQDAKHLGPVVNRRANQQNEHANAVVDAERGHEESERRSEASASSSSSPPPLFAPATRVGEERRPVGRRAPQQQLWLRSDL